MSLLALAGLLLVICGYVQILLIPAFSLKLHHYDGANLNLLASAWGVVNATEALITTYVFQDAINNNNLQLFFKFYGITDPFYQRGLVLAVVALTIIPTLNALVVLALDSFFAYFSDKKESATSAFGCLLHIILHPIQSLASLLRIIKIYMKRLLKFISNPIDGTRNLWGKFKSALALCSNVEAHLNKLRLIYGFCFSGYYPRSKEKAVRGDPFEFMLFRSLTNSDFIIITLKSNKVYIGMVREITERSKHLKSEPAIKLKVIASGHRNKETQILELNHTYVIGEGTADEKILAGDVYVKQSEISSLSPFIKETKNSLAKNDKKPMWKFLFKS